MNLEEPRFSVGQNVKYLSTGKIGTVNKVIPGRRGYSYRVTVEGKSRVVAERYLEGMIDQEDSFIEDFQAGDLGNSEDYRLFHTWLRLRRPIESNIYSYLSSKTIFNPHQFKPLFRFLSDGSKRRLFIADEVGVGKTIEAGIILIDLLAREELSGLYEFLSETKKKKTWMLKEGPFWFDGLPETYSLMFASRKKNSHVWRHFLHTHLGESSSIQQPPRMTSSPDGSRVIEFPSSSTLSVKAPGAGIP